MDGWIVGVWVMQLILKWVKCLFLIIVLWMFWGFSSCYEQFTIISSQSWCQPSSKIISSSQELTSRGQLQITIQKRKWFTSHHYTLEMMVEIVLKCLNGFYWGIKEIRLEMSNSDSQPALSNQCAVDVLPNGTACCDQDCSFFYELYENKHKKYKWNTVQCRFKRDTSFQSPIRDNCSL